MANSHDKGYRTLHIRGISEDTIDALRAFSVIDGDTLGDQIDKAFDYTIEERRADPEFMQRVSTMAGDLAARAEHEKEIQSYRDVGLGVFFED